MTIPTRIRRRTPWNPLACSDTLFRPHVLLMAKLAWLLLLFGGYGGTLLAPSTPAVGLLDAIPAAGLWLNLAFWGGGVCLLLNRGVAVACALAGGAVLLAPFQSLVAWQPHAWVAGGVLVLCALQTSGDQTYLIRWFTALVYGAGLLGSLTADGWIAVSLAEPWNEADFVGDLVRPLDTLLPAGVLSTGLRVITLATCVLVPLGLLLPRLCRSAATLGLTFHIILYLALGTREAALFAGAIAIAQISCLEWPRSIVVLWPRACGWPAWLRVALDRYDFERRTDWPRPPDPDANLETWFDLRPMAGAKAVVNLVLCFPTFYFAALLSFVCVHALLPAFVAVPLNSVMALALVAFSVYASITATRVRLLGRRSRGAMKRDDVAATDSDAPSEPHPTTSSALQDEVAETDVLDVRVETDTPPQPDR